MEGGGEVGLKSGLAFNKFYDNHRKFIFSSQYKYIKPDFSEWARSEPGLTMERQLSYEARYWKRGAWGLIDWIFFKLLFRNFLLRKYRFFILLLSAG